MDTTKLPVEMIPTKSIQVMGTNREQTNDAGLAELQVSMEAHGLLQPIIVYCDRDRNHVCVAGARRLAAAKALKWKEIPAKVITADMGATEDVLREIRLVENLQRAELTPFEEADQLAVLEASYTKPPRLEDLAAKLGKGTVWLAQRRAINKLAEPLRQYVQRCNWPCSLIVMLAREPETSHESIAKSLEEMEDTYRDLESNLPYIPDADNLGQILERYHTNLTRAPWKLDDAKLLPKAGPCSCCTKRSGADVLLFPEAVEGIDHCLDADCWKKKEQAVIQVQLDKFLKKKLKPVVIAASNKNHEAPPGAKVCTWASVERCTAADEGAVPAVSTLSTDFGETFYVRPWNAGNNKAVEQDTGKPAKKPKPAEPQSDTDLAMQVVRKRILATINYWKDDTLPNLEPDLATVMALVAAFGTEPFPSAGAESWEAFDSFNRKSPASLAKEVYDEVFPVLQKRLESEGVDVAQLWAELHQQAKAFNDQESLTYCWGQAIKDHKWPKQLGNDPHTPGVVQKEVVMLSK